MTGMHNYRGEKEALKGKKRRKIKFMYVTDILHFMKMQRAQRHDFYRQPEAGFDLMVSSVKWI